jgi:hypothetical protein
MNYQKEATNADGALKSNPFSGFEVYETAAVKLPTCTPAEEAAEGDHGPKAQEGIADFRAYS